MQKLRMDDEVIVLAGKDKGKIGKITAFRTKKKQKTVIVSKVNMVKKSRRQEKKEGPDFVTVERPINISNVAVVSPKTKKATRVRIEQRNNKNVRIAVACGTVLKNEPKKKT